MFKPKSKIEIQQDFEEEIKKAKLRYDYIKEHTYGVKDLKKLLDSLPDDMPVGFKFKSNDQFIEHINIPLKISKSRLIIDKFDGNHSYRVLSEPITTLIISLEDLRNEYWDIGKIS